MRTRTAFLVVAALFAAFTFSTPAFAAHTFYSDRGSFLGALTNSYTENFAGLTAATREGAIDAPQDFSGNGMSFSVNTQPAPNDLYLLVNGETKWLTVNNSANSLVFSLTSGNITAIGGNFFLTDQRGNYVAGQIDMIASGPSEYGGVGSSSNDPNNFLGLIFDTPITSMTLTAPQYDNISWVTAGTITVGQVPEPSTYALLLMTGAGALWMTRRRR